MKAIVKAANAIIKENRNQIPKGNLMISMEREILTDFRAASDNEEGKWLTELFILAYNKQIKDKFAIPYRTNAQHNLDFI